MAFSLDNRVALVTGSTMGLGRAMATALARAGARVALNFSNNEARAYKALAALQSTGAACILVRADVTDEHHVTSLVRQVEQALGPIDILVPNATPPQPMRLLEDYTWGQYQKMLDYFVKSPFLLSRACVPGMKQRRWGRIINIISEVYSTGVAPFTAYAAAKGGQVGFSRSLATELAPYGITVNMISPGWIPTARHAGEPESVRQRYLQSIPAGRWGVPDDIGGAAVFFASDEAAFATGQFVTVNGGRSFGI